MAWQMSTTCSEASKKRTSMGIFMKKVCTLVQGSICNPSPSGSSATPIKPRRRVMKVSALAAWLASNVLRVRLVTR